MQVRRTDRKVRKEISRPLEFVCLWGLWSSARRDKTQQIYGKLRKGVQMLGSASAVQRAADLPVADRSTLWARATATWWAVVGVALLSLLVGVVLTQDLGTSRSPSLRSTERSEAGLSVLPLAAQGQISAALGADDRAYRVSPAGDGFRAANPAQHMSSRFDRAGVMLESGALRLGLSMRGVGFGASLTALGSVPPRMAGNRVVYVRGGLREWYVNGPVGLEQGFTVVRAPAGRHTGPLTLSMALSGNARASLASGGKGLVLNGADGSSLRYSGLVAHDALGRTLPSRLALEGGRVLLRVDTHGARYPLTIDPLIQQGEKLTGGGESGKAWFGYSVALSSNGKTALIGGQQDNSKVGAAWVFTRTGSTWTQQGEKLTGGGEVGAGSFGISVALSANGNTALIGGSQDNGNIGAAWVFTRSGSTWTQQGEKLTGFGETGTGTFGESVALSASGSTALIGGPSDHPGEKEELGAAWIFTRSEGVWSQPVEKLTVTKEESKEAGFGWSVALSAEGNTALIGAKNNGTPYYEHHGAVWVFILSESRWVSQAKLTPKEAEGTEEEFGYSVALSANGNTALIGAPKEYNKTTESLGSAWVFTRSGSTWTQQGKKFYPNGAEGADELGWSVSLSGDGNTALLGGWADNLNGKTSGSVWLFARVGSTWLEEGRKYRAVGEEKGSFGWSVALSSEGDTALVGDPEVNTEVGGAYAFTYTFSPEELYGPENEGEPSQHRPCSGDPVNCATGNHVETQTDLSVGGVDPACM
jgi:hypothetical protein